MYAPKPERSAPVRRKRPTVATPAPAHTGHCKVTRRTTDSMTGVMTTYRPVMNAEADGVAVFRPIVCVA